MLAERGEVDVVLEHHGQPESRLEVAAERVALEPGDARRERDPPPLGVDHAGDAHDRAVQERRVEARRRDEPCAQLIDLVEHAHDVAAADLDVEPRAHVAAKVADRPAQEPAADVEAEHERRLRDRLEEDRAVPRAGRARSSPRGRVPASSSDCSASETVGFEMPARREISAREMGAPARIASSTVRSFRCLRSGGSAGADTRVWEIIGVLGWNPNQIAHHVAGLDFLSIQSRLTVRKVS